MPADFEHYAAVESAVDRDAFQKRHGIIGRSIQIREVVDIVMQVAPTDITVLITGESGAGKEVLARAIHNASGRAGRKLVAVNCGAIPEGILESELFGHEKGSFTGAVDARKGYFEIADGGTIFLDEIGEMPVATQVKLLRVIENREFMRVGSSTPTYVDVRIIAATNKDLETEVAAKRFRQDLYYRLRSVSIRVPSLRERRSDILLLTDAFLADIAKQADHSIMLTEDARTLLTQYPWPGNVRELRNVMESISVLERGNVVDSHILKKYLPESTVAEFDRMLPVPLGKSTEQAERELIFRALVEIRSDLMEIKSLLDRRTAPPLQLPASPEESVRQVSLEDYSLEEMEKLMITSALNRFEGNRRLAAKALKISERTLYRKIREFGLT